MIRWETSVHGKIIIAYRAIYINLSYHIHPIVLIYINRIAIKTHCQGKS